MMTAPVAAAIDEHLRRDGALSIADYMTLCAEAYYARGTTIGGGGDFITAPEISQTFGEVLGLWCAVTWRQMGAPRPVHLVECGPGRGTLMADVVRAARQVPEFIAAAQIHLVERSAALKAQQRQALSDMAVQWHDDLDRLPDGPLILIANEFLDALPIRQFQRTAEGWAERVIVRDRDGRLAFSARPVADAPVPIGLAATAEMGAIFERSAAVECFAAALAARLKKHGGAALLIDYGHGESALGETLQAVKAHRYHDVLTDPGEADLTAHVDFAAVARAARQAGAAVLGAVDQGPWLRRLGIGVRQVQLARGKSAAQARAIEQGVQRLTDPHGMGLLFKVMAIAHPTLTSLEGF
jgi:NADH dehydrogenase [ubiquinone] 1 alpha subcomplex assembly factor 7